MTTMMKVLTAGLVLGAAAMGGCKSGCCGECQTPAAGDVKATEAKAAGPVNSVCAIENEDPVDESVTVAWRGQTVGFCCPGCIKEWAKLSDSQKDAAVAKAISLSTKK